MGMRPGELENSSGMKRCARCGAEYQEGQGICRVCGHSLRDGGGGGILHRLFGRLARAFVKKPGRVVTRARTASRSPGIAGPSKSAPQIDSLSPEARRLIEQAREVNPNVEVQVKTATDGRSGTITVVEDGRRTTYESWEDMPPDVRERYEEHLRQIGPTGTVPTRVTVDVNGVRKTFTEMRQLPPEIRERIEAMKRRGEAETDAS
jgi:hypothetical protein